MSIKKEISILYVDDESILHKTFKPTMEMLTGFKVDSAHSGMQALDMTENTSYDTIISDYDMPGMNGLELLKIIRGRGDDIPYIIFTGKSSEEVVIEALNSGVDFYLLKDAEIDSICSELKRKIPPLVEERIIKITQSDKRQAMQDMIEHSPDSAYLLNADKKIITVNKGGRNFINSFSDSLKPDITGMSFYDILPHQIAEIKNNLIDKTAEEGEETIFYEEYMGKRYKNYITPHYNSRGDLQYISYFQRLLRKGEKKEGDASHSVSLEMKLKHYKDNLAAIQFPLIADIAATIIFALADGPKNMGELCEINNSSTPNITSRLKALKEKNIVNKNNNEYRLTVPGSIIADKIKGFIISINRECHKLSSEQEERDYSEEDISFFIRNKSDAQAIIRSTIQTTILLALYEEMKSRYLLREITGSSSVALSPKIAWLKEKGLIDEKDHEYCLTKKGRIVAVHLEEYILTSAVIYRNEDFWAGHSLDWMPDFAKDTLYELIHAEVHYNSPDEIISNEELNSSHLLEPKYLHGVSDYSLHSLPSISFPRICRHHNCEFVISEDEAEERPELREHIRDIDERLTSFVKIHISKFPHTFSIIVTEKYFEMKLMTDNCKFFDSIEYLVSTSPEACMWGERLFQYYKNASVPYIINTENSSE
ncbi:response regulator [Methanoplanus endosymbiosus]|uniref:Response regulator n=1 Tax=Methanoplanus endosymbiosus TaxID=33865 RepID=A0A9E7PLB7_9EURY|nr:response regulator [Methanoplanus endosymbiosus]UUX91442.1 response regulator [Methanoplanus endosymbiosus]